MNFYPKNIKNRQFEKFNKFKNNKNETVNDNNIKLKEMILMFWNNNKEEKEDRSHQDNFWGKNYSKDGHDNGSYQYCKFCNRHTSWIYDRCGKCKNNQTLKESFIM